MPDAFAIFERLLDLPEAERVPALDGSCGGDAEVRREVMALLAADADADGFLEPALDDNHADAIRSGVLTPSSLTALGAPDEIGPYKVEKQIGEGGFGIVYEARQSEPIERRVALKVIKPGMDSAAVLRRFEMERRTLGLLEHTNIARVLDAGLVPEGQPGAGRPFFAMEYVDGRPITAFAEQERLGLRERLGLVMQVCAAAQHAHTKGVIHRDLKPANIPVTLIDGEPVCKVIDYGIAKALGDDGELADAFTALTSPGAMIGTPLYMSPEQANAGEVDTRSDVYAIGVLLYELLCGKTPFDEAMSGTRDPGRIRSALESAEPASPSTRLGRATRSEDAARAGGPSLEASALRGELDWITMKAIAREPDRRYASALALAEDLRRYLADEPVEAGPESRAYRVSKFVRRNRVGVVATGIAAAGILAGSVFSVWFGVRAEAARAAEAEQRKEAERNTAIAEAVNQFLNDDLLSAVDPTRTADREITMREVLNIASEKIGGRFEDQPMVEAAIRGTLASTYERLGNPQEAEPHRLRAIALLAEALGEGDEQTITARASLVTNHMNQSRFDEAVSLLTADIDLMRGRPELQGLLVRSKSNLAAVYLEQGRFEDAAPLLAETLEAKREELGDRDPSTLTSIHNLAGLYFALSQLERSERLYKEAYEGRASVLGDSDPKTVSSATMWCRALIGLERFEQANSVIREFLEITRTRFDPGHPYHINLVGAYAMLLSRTGEYERAAPVYEEALSLRETHQGPDHVSTIQTMSNLAQVRSELGLHEEALALYSEVRERQSRVLPEGHWNRATTLMLIGVCHIELGRTDLAEPLLVKGACELISAMGAPHPRSEMAIDALIRLYEEQGRQEDADQIRDLRGTNDITDFICRTGAD